MSKDKISDYSATANSNTDIGGINIDEGCAPSGINDAIRTLMKQLKDFQQGTNSDPFNGPHNGTVGATTPASGAFTTLSASSTLSVTGAGTIQGLTVGKGAGSVSTNTAVGASALGSGSQSGGYNTAVGYQAAASNTSANTTTAFGAQALYSNTTGTRNAAFGALALYSNTTGGFNAAFGGYDGTGSVPPLYSNTTGSYNAAFGNGALAFNTVSSYNTAVGYQAGYSSNHTADANGYNVLIGFQAGYTLTTGSNNCFVGSAAGAVVTTGTNNTFVGANTSVGACGAAVTTGSKNTILGGYSGNQGGLDIRTASNYIVLSDGDGNPRIYYDNSIGGTVFRSRNEIRDGAFIDNATNGNNKSIFLGTTGLFPGNGTGGATDNSYNLGSSFYRWSVVYAATGTINTSDANQKQDIAALDDAEKRVATAIKSLMKKYRFRDAVAEKGNAARIHIGAVAQEVQAAFVAEGLDPARYALFCSDTWYEVDGKASADEPYTAETEGAVEVTRLGLRYDELLAFVIAAL